METLEAIQREIAYRKHTLRFQEQQTEILRQQTNIIKKQTLFTELLALATIILGLSAFYNVIDNFFTTGEPFPKVFIVLLIISIIVFFGIFIRLLYQGMKYLFRKKK